MSLLALKNRRKTINMIYRASSAMKAAAAVRVRKVEGYLEDSLRYENAFGFNNNAVILSQLFLEFAMNKNSTKKANILIGCDKGMCGDFVNALSGYYKKKKDEADFWFVFGAKLEGLCNNPKTIFCSSVNLDQFSMLVAGNIIWRLINQHQICELNLNYFSKDKIVQVPIFSKSLMEKALMVLIDQEVDFELHKDMAITFLAKKMYLAMLESALEENKQRLFAMTQAKTNAEDMGKVITRLYNKARQEKITRELTEITAGII